MALVISVKRCRNEKRCRCKERPVEQQAKPDTEQARDNTQFPAPHPNAPPPAGAFQAHAAVGGLHALPFLCCPGTTISSSSAASALLPSTTPRGLGLRLLTLVLAVPLLFLNGLSDPGAALNGLSDPSTLR